jgi:large subunit ribosomal protein L17
MKHGKKVNHLGRKVAHRKSMLANMASSLIEHKRISTTVAKAKALKQFVEPLITKSKNDTTHNRRLAFSALRNKYAVAELFRAVAQKVGDRPGGYTRVIKMGNRLGDNASMAMIELVDFNEVYNNEKAAAKKSTRRSRSRKKGDDAAPAATDQDAKDQSAENVAEETPAPAPKAKAKAKVKKTPKTEDKKVSEPEKGADE